MQAIKGCRRRLHHPEKLTFAGLRPARPLGAAAEKECQPSLAELLKLHVGIEADFFGGGRVGPRECIRLRPGAFEAISTPCRAETFASP